MSEEDLELRLNIPRYLRNSARLIRHYKKHVVEEVPQIFKYKDSHVSPSVTFIIFSLFFFKQLT